MLDDNRPTEPLTSRPPTELKLHEIDRYNPMFVNLLESPGEFPLVTQHAKYGINYLWVLKECKPAGEGGEEPSVVINQTRYRIILGMEATDAAGLLRFMKECQDVPEEVFLKWLDISPQTVLEACQIERREDFKPDQLNELIRKRLGNLETEQEKKAKKDLDSLFKGFLWMGHPTLSAHFAQVDGLKHLQPDSRERVKPVPAEYGDAVCGGELRFVQEIGKWQINNASGRHSGGLNLNRGQWVALLDEVAKYMAPRLGLEDGLGVAEDLRV
jgi:hypothetical protein